MNKLFPIVLALVFFGCESKAVDDKATVIDNLINDKDGWTKKREALFILDNFSATSSRKAKDDTRAAWHYYGAEFKMLSCTKMDWIECHLDFFKEDFSGSEFDYIRKQEPRKYDNNQNISDKSYRQRISKVDELSNKECGEKFTTNLDLLEFYSEWLNLREYIYTLLKSNILSPDELKIDHIDKEITDPYEMMYHWVRSYELPDFRIEIDRYLSAEDIDWEYYSKLRDLEYEYVEYTIKLRNQIGK